MLPNPQARVLYVDANEDSRMMLVTLLGLASIEAKAVGSAEQALALIQAEQFDLYVLDGWLPKVDGFELCRRLRTLAPEALIVFFSGAGYEADKEKGFRAGANAYVVKPGIDELIQDIQQLTQQGTERRLGNLPELRPISLLTMHAHGTG